MASFENGAIGVTKDISLSVISSGVEIELAIVALIRTFDLTGIRWPPRDRHADQCNRNSGRVMEIQYTPVMFGVI